MTSLERAYAISNLLRRASDAKSDAERTDYEGQAIRILSEFGEEQRDKVIGVLEVVMQDPTGHEQEYDILKKAKDLAEPLLAELKT